MRFPFAPVVRDLHRDYVRLVLSFQTKNLIARQWHEFDQSIGWNVSEIILLHWPAFFPTFCLEQEDSVLLIPPSDLVQKDRSESFFYSLTLHCDLLSGSREPLARPAGEGPRTIRTWSRFTRNDWTTRLFGRTSSYLRTLSFLTMHRVAETTYTNSRIRNSRLIFASRLVHAVWQTLSDANTNCSLNTESMRHLRRKPRSIIVTDR